MIDETFFESLGKISFQTDIEEDTFQAIDRQNDIAIMRIYIIVSIICFIFLGLSLTW